MFGAKLIFKYCMTYCDLCSEITQDFSKETIQLSRLPVSLEHSVNIVIHKNKLKIPAVFLFILTCTVATLIEERTGEIQELFGNLMFHPPPTKKYGVVLVP